jgi:hypothetical protein
MSALTIDPPPSQEVLAWIPGSASGQANVALMDSSKGWNLPSYFGSNTGSYSPGSTISFYQTQEQILSPGLEARLNELSLLKHGWDEEDALQINSQAIEATRRALRRLSLLRSFQGPSIVPTFDGFLQLEWHNPSRSLEFEYTPGGWSILGVDSVNTEHPRYNTELVPLKEAADLEPFFNWFSTHELIWPSR